jgi:hypothetical protein
MNQKQRQALFEQFRGKPGTTTFTLTVITPQELFAACLSSAEGNQRATRLARAVADWLKKANEVSVQESPICLGCTMEFNPSTLPAAVCVVDNFKETHSMLSGVCDACFKKAEASGDVVSYLTQYYKDIWPDLAEVKPGSA